jgi:hypothetical protein
MWLPFHVSEYSETSGFRGKQATTVSLPAPAEASAASARAGCADRSAVAFLCRTTLTLMQPLAKVALTRPWHWGIAVLGDPVAEVPTEFDGTAVALGRDVITLSVRHAQDVEADRLDGDWDWATATIHPAFVGSGGSHGKARLVRHRYRHSARDRVPWRRGRDAAHPCPERTNPPDRVCRKGRTHRIGDTLG